MRRKRLILICTVFTATFCSAMLIGTEIGNKLNRPIPVSLCAVEKGSMTQTLQACGTVRGVEEYAVLYPASGTVAQVYVAPGQLVTQGQALFRMDAAAQELAVSTLLQEYQEPDALLEKASQLLELPAAAISKRAAPISLTDAIRQLEAMTARAPAAGIVRQVNAVRYGGGAMGAPAVTMSSTAANVMLSLVPRDAKQLKIGMRAQISLDGDQLGAAQITRISPPCADPLTGQALYEVTLTPDTPLSLLPGTQVDVRICLTQYRDVPVLPAAAVTASQTVWWVLDGHAWETPVNVLMADDTQCWINMQEGMQVIAEPHAMDNGQRVSEVLP